MALLMGGSVAFFFFAMPIALIEQAVFASGLPTVLAAAAPPLGGTARLLIVGAAATAMAAATWIAITLAGALFQPRPRKPRPARQSPPRRADAHPDAPARKPIFASSDFAIPEEPEPPIEAEWAEVVEYEADDTLELVDIAPDDDVTPAPAEQPSITRLMARLEAGAERRAAKVRRTPAPATPEPAAAGELDSAIRDALDELQRMAGR